MKLGAVNYCGGPDCPSTLPDDADYCSDACWAADVRYHEEMASLNEVDHYRRIVAFKKEHERRSDWMAASAPAGAGAAGLARRIR